ncbi:MAG: hypothetical protein OEW06_07940 [Gemmatimonadota bacterium]|nr:hypothetical protein [Gemmatimonadota bacterium]
MIIESALIAADYKALCEAQHGETYLHGGVERAKGLLRHLGCLVQRDGVEVLRALEQAAA